MVRAESNMHRVMRTSPDSDDDDDAIGALGLNRAVLVRMISSEALLPCILQFLVISQTLYTLYSAWLACALLSFCYHLKMLLFAGDKTVWQLEAISSVMISYFVVLWLGASVEQRTRTFFLLARRENANAKREQKRVERHRLALLELQASAGMSRLYHVLKNIFVGINDSMRARDEEITPQDREMIAAQARTGIDFIMQRAAFVALAKGIYSSNIVCTDLHTFFSTMGILSTVPWGASAAWAAVRTAAFETTMLRCVVIDTLMNAITHGDGDVRLEYWVTPYRPAGSALRALESLRLSGAAAESWWRAGSARMHVRVTNRARADRPRLTSARVAQLTQGDIDDSTRGEHSTGIGLGSSTYSLHALGGYVVLTQDGDIVSCLLTLPARDVDSLPPMPATPPPGSPHVPPAQSPLVPPTDTSRTLAAVAPSTVLTPSPTCVSRWDDGVSRTASEASSEDPAILSRGVSEPAVPTCAIDMRGGAGRAPPSLLDFEAQVTPTPFEPTAAYAGPPAPFAAAPALSPTTHITTLDDSPIVTRM